jgi:hypothetical protein
MIELLPVPRPVRVSQMTHLVATEKGDGTTDMDEINVVVDTLRPLKLPLNLSHLRNMMELRMYALIIGS